MTFYILLYHGIDSDEHPYRYRCVDELEWIISRETFRDHMEILHGNGFRAVTLNDLLSLKNGGDLCWKPIIISFDDGHETNFSNVLPILDQFNFKAEFFITTDWIDTENYMNRTQLVELSQAGMSIQSHGRSHRFLTTLDDEELHDELRCSREKLSELLRRNVQYISYPGGRYDIRVERCVREAGYEGSLTSVRGRNSESGGLFGLKREPLTRDVTQRGFEALIRGGRLYFAMEGFKKLLTGMPLKTRLWKQPQR